MIRKLAIIVKLFEMILIVEKKQADLAQQPIFATDL